ncbi:hypothetical protein PLICRDRAFT_217699 [Plicaturopsis crispa FD-325 SS-3]|nr:hypothetical protein PLICRDRAFT_217699 [Plicaturopsis crispa FD-325 SS-3]
MAEFSKVMSEAGYDVGSLIIELGEVIRDAQASADRTETEHGQRGATSENKLWDVKRVSAIESYTKTVGMLHQTMHLLADRPPRNHERRQDVDDALASYIRKFQHIRGVHQRLLDKLTIIILKDKLAEAKRISRQGTETEQRRREQYRSSRREEESRRHNLRNSIRSIRLRHL